MSEYISKKELELYKPILIWLQEYLSNKFPRSTIRTFDVHSIDLSEFLQKSPYKKFFPEYPTYKIRVDLLGLIIKNDICSIVFVEVKDTSLSLINLSQLIGYCKIVIPGNAFLISPKGLGRPLHSLLNIYKRNDILEYSNGKSIKIIKWDGYLNQVAL